MTMQLNNNIRFKADAQAAAIPVNNVNYNNRYTPPMPQEMPADDVFMMQAMAEQRAEKQAKSQQNWDKVGVAAQVGIALGFLTTAALGVLGAIGLKKFGKAAAAGNHANDELKALTKVNLKWEDFGTQKTVAPLDSKTTAKSLKKAFDNIISNRGLSDDAKKWGGVGNNIDIMYLYGHGGTGKTYVAKQFAQETGSMFTCIKYPDLGSPYKDAASMRISSCFDEIIAKANAQKDKKFVVCIDEIDAVMRKVPDGQHGAEEVAKSRAAVLTGLDKLRDKCANVTVIATSNYHPKNGIVDPIALRRFNNKIEVPLPNKKQISALLEMYLKDIGAIDKDKFFKSSEFKSFVSKLEREGYSNGEVELIAKEAGKIFGSSLKKVSDSDLKKHPFKVKYLQEAMKMNGEAASKTNKLMDVKKGSGSGSNNDPVGKLTFWQKLAVLFSKH